MKPSGEPVDFLSFPLLRNRGCHPVSLFGKGLNSKMSTAILCTLWLGVEQSGTYFQTNTHRIKGTLLG